MNIHIYESKHDIDEVVSQTIIDLVKQKPNSVLGLATGSTPLGVYAKLIDDYKENKTDYSNVVTVNLDEYIGLKQEHPESYHSFMHKNLFDHINVSDKNINLPDGMSSNPLEACKLYNEILDKNVPDIQLLGLGENGHIGFNEPNTSFDSITQIVLLAKETRLSNARFFNHIDDVPTHAITMGIKSIMSAKKIILIAVGTNKAAAVKAMVSGDMSEALPASILQDHADVDIYLDRAAAHQLLLVK